MGAAQLKQQYHLTQPLSVITGSYSFIKFSKGRHPTTKRPISLFAFKNPHRLINPPCESQFVRFTEVKEYEHYTVALSEDDAEPLFLMTQALSVLERRLLLKVMIEKPAEVGRYYFINGKYKLWSEDKRGFECMAPEHVKQGKISENSNVFCSAVAFVNYLSFALEKTKQGFFQPKTKQQFLTSANDLRITIETTDFWHVLDAPLKDLLKEMLNPAPAERITYKQLNNHFYLTQPIIKVYYDLCELYSYKLDRQLQFLQLLDKNLYLFETAILKRYILPILVDYMANRQIAHECVACVVEALNRCNLIDTYFFEKVVLDRLVNLLKNNPTVKTVYSLLLKAEHWSNYMSVKQFDMYFGAMLLKAYEATQPQMFNLAIHKTQLFFDRLVDAGYRDRLEKELLERLVNISDSGLKLKALKCVYTLLRANKLPNREKVFKCIGEITTDSEDAIIHIMRIYNLQAITATVGELLNKFMPKISKYLSAPSSKVQFDYAFGLYSAMLERIRQLQSDRFSEQGQPASQGSHIDYQNEQEFILPKQLPQELKLSPTATDTSEFTYFRHAEISFTERQNQQFNVGNKIEIGNGDDGEYEYSEHFGGKSHKDQS